MVDYRKINALQRDPAKARRLAQFLLKLKDIEWTDWEADFLQAIAEHREDLSIRQAEKLAELEEGSVWYERIDGFSVKLLVGTTYALHHLLGEHDQDFIKDLRDKDAAKLRRRGLGRLLRCARAVGEIESYQARTLEPPLMAELA